MPKKLTPEIGRHSAKFFDGKEDEAEQFLKEKRDRFDYMLEAWKDIRDQHDTDMKFLAGEQWEEKEKTRRQKAHIPYITLDELTQFVNQLVNDIRQNKHAVAVSPKGAGATNRSAQHRADWIRGIEYQSQGQTAYVTAAERMIGGSYGFVKLECEYEGMSFNQTCRIRPVPNENTVLMDPDCIHYDCSDGEDAFEFAFMSEARFKRLWPNAQIKSFTDEIKAIAPNWIKEGQVQVASYWYVEIEKIEICEVDLGDKGVRVMRTSELPKKLDMGRILKRRDWDDRKIIQYMMNGVEVLEKKDPRPKDKTKEKAAGWPGQWIPLIPFWGKEYYIDFGSGSKRLIESLIRKARDPQRLFNYYASQELMEAKMSPRTPYMGPRGMFSNNKEEWGDVNETPKGFIEWDQPEGFPPGSVKPERIPFQPNFQLYEIAKEAASRSIQKAMGISPLPVEAQRANEKSGIALKRIQGERAQGSFHFIDNFDRSISYVGRQLDDVYDKIVDSARDVTGRKEDGTFYLARVKDPKHPKNVQDAGDHDVTIATGPSADSEREEAAQFADTLAEIPGVFQRIGDLIVRLRNVGPIGEQMADRLTPPEFANKPGQDDFPPQAKAIVNQLQQQLQLAQQAIQQLTQEKAAKMMDGSVKLKITALQEQTKLIVAQANLQADRAELILQNEYTRLQAIWDGVAEHTQIAHTADQDRATAEHAASLTPPAEGAQTGPAGGGGAAPGGQQ